MTLDHGDELTLLAGLSILDKMIVLGYEEEAENICNRSAFYEHPLVKKVKPLTSGGTSGSGIWSSIAAGEVLLGSLTTCRMVSHTQPAASLSEGAQCEGRCRKQTQSVSRSLPRRVARL